MQITFQSPPRCTDALQNQPVIRLLTGPSGNSKLRPLTTHVVRLDLVRLRFGLLLDPWQRTPVSWRARPRRLS